MTLTDEGLVDVPGLASHWIRLAGGAKAHYVTSGTEGPAVILLHGGLPGSSGTAGWRFAAPYLGANGFRVYCPDMPAFGLSDSRPEHRPAGLQDHVDFLHEFVTAMGLDRFHLAGNSMGCTNTVNYTLAHPDRVISYALIAGEVGDVVPPTKTAPGNVDLLRYDGTRDGMRRLMEGIIFHGEEISDDLVEMRFQAAARHQEAHTAFFPSILQYGQVIPWQDPNTAARLSTVGRLDRLTIPSIYLYGTEDVLIPVGRGYEIEDVLTNTQFFYPPECGHQGQTDRPDIFNPVLLEFFRDGQVSRETADLAGVSRRRPEIPSLVRTD